MLTKVSDDKSTEVKKGNGSSLYHGCGCSSKYGNEREDRDLADERGHCFEHQYTIYIQMLQVLRENTRCKASCLKKLIKYLFYHWLSEIRASRARLKAALSASRVEFIITSSDVIITNALPWSMNSML